MEQTAADLREIIQSAAWEATFRSQTLSNKLNAEALIELKEKHGVKIERTPPDILTKMLAAWDQIAKEEEAKNPFFKKVYDVTARLCLQGRACPARGLRTLRAGCQLLLAREVSAHS